MKRKIYRELQEWKSTSNGNSAILIEGARRIGKSYIVEEFARNEYDSYIMINFRIASREVKSWFDIYLEDIDKLLANIQLHYDKRLTPRHSIIAILGKGDLAKARKELASKNEELAKLQAKIAKLEAEKASLKQKHESDISKLRNGYQKEIDAAIRRAEIAERKVAEKEAVIERQKSRLDELDRKVNPQRYRLSSGAELIGHHFLGNNPYTVTLKIWTNVKEIEHTAVTYLSDSDKRLHAFSNGELIEHEFINACFSAAEQVSEMQSNLLGAAIELATGGAAQPHVGTGGGGSTSELPWRDKDKNFNKRTTIKRH